MTNPIDKDGLQRIEPSAKSLAEMLQKAQSDEESVLARSRSEGEQKRETVQSADPKDSKDLDREADGKPEKKNREGKSSDKNEKPKGRSLYGGDIIDVSA